MRPIATRLSIAASLALVMCVSVALPSASGVTVGTSVDDPSSTDVAIASVVEHLGVTSSEAEARILAQEHFNAVNELAAGTFGADSFDAWVVGTKDQQVLGVRTMNKGVADLFRGQIPQEALEVVDAEALVPLARAALATVRVTGTDLMYIDPKDGAIVVVVHDEDRGAVIAEEVLHQAQVILPAVRVRTEVSVEEMGDTANVYGGGGLDNCTNGFTAVKGSVVGFITAGHCGTPRNYYSGVSNSGTAAGAATQNVQRYNTNADLQFMAMNSNSIVNKFYGSSTSTPVVRGARMDSVVVGSTICTRGRSWEASHPGAGYHCGVVTSTSATPTWSGACPGGACLPGFIAVNMGCLGGDSGGPLVSSSGNRPIGIMKGGSTTYSVYSWLHRMDGTGVSLF